MVAFKSDQPMRDVILVEEIIELTALARAILGDYAEAGKVLVPLQPSAPHDECLDDRLTDARQFSKRLSETIRGHFQDFAFVGFAARAAQRRCSREHSD